MEGLKINVYLVDDHKIFVQGIAKLLSAEPSINIIGYAYDAKSALTFFKENIPHILITDIRMTGLSGIDLTRIIKEEYPEIKVIGLSMFDKPEIIKELLDAGAEGYLLKDLEKNELVRAIHEVHDGKIYYSGSVSEVLLKTLDNKDFLTKREKEIIGLISKEKTNSEIADQLFISTHTVESHRKNIFRKTKAKTIVGLINYAHENKLS